MLSASKILTLLFLLAAHALAAPASSGGDLNLTAASPVEQDHADLSTTNLFSPATMGTPDGRYPGQPIADCIYSSPFYHHEYILCGVKWNTTAADLENAVKKRGAVLTKFQFHEAYANVEQVFKATMSRIRSSHAIDCNVVSWLVEMHVSTLVQGEK
jgi:hypothetical protein